MAIRSIIRTASLVVVAVATLIGSAGAGPLEVALVEKVSGDSNGVEFMDYVHTGQVISLGSGDTIVLGYLYSCVQETITGGVVTVGPNQREVQAGAGRRNRVQCEAGRGGVIPEQSSAFSGRIFCGVRDQEVRFLGVSSSQAAQTATAVISLLADVCFTSVTRHCQSASPRRVRVNSKPEQVQQRA